jgi:hypothetical protein
VEIFKKVAALIALIAGAVSMIGGGSCVWVMSEDPWRIDSVGLRIGFGAIGLIVAFVGYCMTRFGRRMWGASGQGAIKHDS